MNDKFARELLSIGIISYREQETLWDIAVRCGKTTGVPTATVGFLYGTAMGSVTIPGIGAVPGAVAGALAGLVSGTVSCVMINQGLRSQLRQFAKESVQ